MIIRFSFRAKEKHFTLASIDECRKVCEILAEVRVPYIADPPKYHSE